jgi:hypothetical protein
MSSQLEGIDFQSDEPDLDFIPIEEEKPSRFRSLLSAAPKGFAKELREQLTKTLGFLPEKLGITKKGEELSPISNEEFFENLEKVLPTQEGFAEKALERGGRIAPYALAGGGNLAGQGLRSALAGFLGEGAKEAGLPEWAQALAELPAFGAPGLGKKIRPTGAQKELVEGARNLGLSEQEITPLIQSELKQKWLTKFAPKRGRTQAALSKSKQALGNVYERLENSESAKNLLSKEQSSEVVKNIDDILEKLPSGVRDEISQDFQDLLSKPISGESLINFWKDLNHYISKGTDKLGIVKGPITDALENISPELASDFRMTNQLYSKYAKINAKLKPSLVGDLMSAGRAVRTLLGVTTGNYPLLIEALSESTGKRVARELLINPRLQNISNKMITALNQNKSSAANQFLKEYIKEISKEDQELADVLSDIDFKELLK